MIRFRPMLKTEFEAYYLGYFIPDYAAEISSNYGLSSDEAIAQAKREIAEDLPNGPETEGQTLVCILDVQDGDEQVVGYLWFRADPVSSSAFINDIYIFPHFQNKGYGKATLNALQDVLDEMGIQHLRLRVAADNERAKHVYESTGFRLTGFNMTKRIGKG
ncbi:GNAT family N-acetyltransferase [Phyllobacterium sp. P30BS-XVII]|uniref:GNAT family N-acetyltransferase n=1 Tax=Phyllobacterium sp. P30BS-XVII TaxID=2587046 RepID=UPI0015FC7F36|nr:GNAT family N-acetyltransferase [Phyllobacterium sp. P30BS-XVII]MBA8903456.1 ribosomal protein S18 acetylase RimI-like enzyme [Phyllobacterium sp. P30BS-XVII]